MGGAELVLSLLPHSLELPITEKAISTDAKGVCGVLCAFSCLTFNTETYCHGVILNPLRLHFSK